jgi:hypothetical protein
MSLHIGAMLPDRALDESSLLKAITKVAIALAGVRAQQVQKRTPALDIMFLLPSRQENPGFEGLRLHSFDSAGQSLKIETAVPQKMVASIHAERYVIAILLDAIDAAAEFFTEQHILFNPAEYAALVNFISVSETGTIN